MRIYYSDRYAIPLPPGHAFPMEKYRLTRDQLLAEGTITHWHLTEPAVAKDEDILLVHEPSYWSRCVRGDLTRHEVRRIGFPWSEGLVRRSRASVQGTILAAESALRDGVSSNLAGGTHHAYADHGEGYCVLNDIAIAIRVLQRDRRIRRATIIDCDVHQGNGTAAIFQGDPDVFTFSMHGEKNFPAHKEQSHLDLALPNGLGDEAYLALLELHLPLLLDQFRPEIVFYQAGVDPHERDRLGKLQLTLDGLSRRDRLVLDACRARRLPVVTTMGGGYGKRIEETVEAHCNTVRAALLLHQTTPSKEKNDEPAHGP